MSKHRFYQIIIGIILLVCSRAAYAGYPMISDIPNQQIDVNTVTDEIPFTISDDVTPPEQLRLRVQSTNRELVPESFSNIIIRGSGTDRTIQVVPSRDTTGYGSIIVTVIDTDGESNSDSFDIEVDLPPIE